VLSHLHQYLQTECGLLRVHQLTETVLRNWLERLSQTPTTKGAPRSASTIETYARSARAFCGWLVEQGVLSCSPLSERVFPRTRAPLPRVVSSATFEQIMRAGFSQHVQARGAKRLVARDRALLWVLFDTGITVAEACAFLRQMDPATRSGLERRQAGGDPLFGSKGKQPLTRNGVTMVFVRFRKRAGISGCMRCRVSWCCGGGMPYPVHESCV
jgi:site-specific recombinase XerD